MDLTRRPAAVGEEGGAGAERGVVAGEEQHGFGDLVGRAQPQHRLAHFKRVPQVGQIFVFLLSSSWVMGGDYTLNDFEILWINLLVCTQTMSETRRKDFGNLPGCA